MRRVLFALVATFVCVMQSFGVPAERVKKSVEQEDGSLLTIVLNVMFRGKDRAGTS